METSDKKTKYKLKWKKGNFECFICKKTVDKVLDVKHTHAPLCSLGCERKYWYEIFYD